MGSECLLQGTCISCISLAIERQYAKVCLHADFPKLSTCTNMTVNSHEAPAPSYAAATLNASKSPQCTSTVPPKGSNASMSSDKKFNAVLYGVNECPPGTPRPIRLDSDLSNAVSVFATLYSTIQLQAIRDCYRLGKFNPSNGYPRPLLIKFVRISDVAKVLTNKGNLCQPPLTRDKRNLLC